MKYPFISFVLAIFILLSLFFLSFLKKREVIMPATIEIDATMIEEVSEKRSEAKFDDGYIKKNAEKKEKILKQVQDDKNNNSDSQNKVLVKYGPLPKIPDHLRDEAFNSFAIARFYINEDGSARAELIKPCTNPELNYLLLKSLQKWKFAESNKESIQDIKVNFTVE
ncbi:MAG: hypothetical protein KGQ36_00525 [Rickettsiales bacterium]|nr:hypothetical protein [Rickettsiales bacterium]